MIIMDKENTLFQSRRSVTVILNLIQDPSVNTLIDFLRFSILQRCAIHWILNQVQDDGYRPPGLEEGVFIYCYRPVRPNCG